MTPGLTSTSPPGGPPLDINAETYPFDVVLENLDRAAYFHFYCAAELRGATEIRGHRARVAGMRLHHDLRRFQTRLAVPPDCSTIKGISVVGESLASLDHNWLFIPDDYQAQPGLAVPEEEFDPGRSQRFVMTEGTCRFGSSADGFQGFGSGMTYPAGECGSADLMAGAVGTITSGFGRFKGLIGTYTLIGRVSMSGGFTGSLMLRVMDPAGRLTGRAEMPVIMPELIEEPGITYLVVRGQKRDRNQKTGFLFGAGGDIVGLNVSQQLRSIQIDAACNEQGLPRADARFGSVIGEMQANIRFNLTNPGAPGSDAAPIPFQSKNTFTFYDRRGGVLGEIDADGGEGRTFRLELPGAPRQNALRFGAFLPLLGGRGLFEGVQGMMTDNSVVGIAPHALATCYVFRIRDSHGKYRSGKAW